MSTPSPGQHCGDGPFTLVPAELVRRLGGGNPAIVYARIAFVCNVAGLDRVEDEAGRWWRAPNRALSEETGLTRSQLRTALGVLLDRGEIESVEHRLDGVTDRTPSYRIAAQPVSGQPSPLDRPDLATHSAEGVSDLANRVAKSRHSSEWSNLATLPISQEEKEEGGVIIRLEPAAPLSDTPPPSHCNRHLEVPAPGPCGACGDARKAAARWQAEQTRRQAHDAEQRRSRIAACGLCDDNGIRDHDGDTVSRCDHHPPHASHIERRSLA